MFFCAASFKLKNSEARQIYIMNIHEYQGKEILASYGVRIQRGIVANSPVEAVAAAKQLTTETGTRYVVKPAVVVGGNLPKNLQQVEEISEQIIGMH
jgi:succinyl-CoA synthetase beta subunit